MTVLVLDTYDSFVYGLVQYVCEFHPECILTEAGKRLVENFYARCRKSERGLATRFPER